MVKTVPHEVLPPLKVTPVSPKKSEVVSPSSFPQGAAFNASAKAEVVLASPLVTAASYFRMAHDALRDGERGESIKSLQLGISALSEVSGVSTLTLSEIQVAAAKTRSDYGQK